MEDLTFDIFNNEERKIKCVSTDYIAPMVNNGNHHLLTVGEIYTVIDVDVHSWHTMITLAEFPNEEFNSALFEELEGENG